MSWSNDQRQRWRAALRIHRQLVQARLSRDTLELPHMIWSRLLTRMLLHQTTLDAQWLHAQAELADDLERLLTDLAGYAQSLQSALKQQREQVGLITLPELWRELEYLEEEFEEVECDLEKSELRVTIPSMVFEGIELGRFQVILEWRKLGQRHCYRIKALDPNPAEVNEEMVHPHVSHEYLCEGDGALSIKQSLQQGRLFDFFLIVQQILTTYNPDSAYHAMDKWFGTPCQSCSAMVETSEGITCPCCDDLVCLDCTGYCSNCTDPRCQGCIKPCSICGDNFCAHCMIHCSACMADGCDACLFDGLCPNCQPNEETEYDESTESPDDEEDDQAGPEAHALCLGEVAVLA